MSRTTRSAWTWRVAALTLLLCAPSAIAGPPALTSTQAAALQGHVDRGDAAFKQGRYVDAIVEYTTGMGISPMPDLVWNIARCHEESGELEQAVAFFERYRSLSIDEEDRVAADEKLALLGQQVLEQNKGTITVHTGRADAEVTIDEGAAIKGQHVDARVAPGHHVVRVTAPGMKPWTGSVDVASAGTAQLTAALEALPPQIGTVVVLCDVPGAIVDLPGGGVARPGERITLAPGLVELVVRAPGHAPVRATANVVADEQQSLHVEPAALAVAAPVIEASPPGPWRWVTLGTGLAMVATAGLLHGLAVSDYNQVLGATIVDGAYANITQNEAAAAQESGDTKISAAQGLYGAGGAVLATSIVLFIVGE